MRGGPMSGHTWGRPSVRKKDILLLLWLSPLLCGIKINTKTSSISVKWIRFWPMRADFTFVRFSLLCILTAGSQVSKLQSKKTPGGAHPLVSRSREGRQISASRHVSMDKESRGSTHFLSSGETAAGVATLQALSQPEFCNRCPENYAVQIHLMANHQWKHSEWTYMATPPAPGSPLH